MRFFRIRDADISALKKIDDKVRDNYNEDRIYIGIILQVNGFEYFAPLTSHKPHHDNIKSMWVYKMHEINNLENKLGMIQLNNMIPLLPSINKIPVKINMRTNYGRLLQNQYLFIQQHKEDISKQALNVYNLSKSSASIRRYCNDFIALENYLSTQK